MLDEFSIGPNDEKNDRVFKLGTGNKLHITRKIAYDHLWEMHFEHGELPPQLKGSWTGFPTARRAMEKYFHNNRIEVDEVI